MVESEQRRSPLPVIIISGPTASGKSTLAINVAKKTNAEIISSDSRQIYRQLKIGTDRLDHDQWQGIEHHLVSCTDLDERFTAFDFARQAKISIEEISGRGKNVIVCGGTGLYIRALVDGIFEISDDDFSYRRELIDLCARKGPVYFHEMLIKIDPEEASLIHPQNSIKVIRALEICHVTGKTKSELIRQDDPRPDKPRFLYIILLPEREKLYQLINARVDAMIEEGLVAEAEAVNNSRFGKAMRLKKIVGYTELIDYFEDKISLDGAINLIKQNSRRYAKRQYTWFRAVKNAEFIRAFGSEVESDCLKLIETFVSQPSN